MIICQPNVQNPTGGIMSLEEKKRLLALAKKTRLLFTTG